MKFFCTAALLSSVLFSAQVGINTTNPKTTFDIRGKSADVTASDGLQAPRLTRLELTNKTINLYGSDQTGALIYITDVSGGDNLQSRINIASVGYYYFDGTLWQKLLNIQAVLNNIYNSNGTTGSGRTVGITDHLNFDNNTLYIDGTNHRIGVGLNNPSTSLQISANNANESGLRLTNLTTASPTSALATVTLAVDANGNVVSKADASSGINTFSAASEASGAIFQVNDNIYTTIPGTSQTAIIPAGGKALFINFMLGIDYVGSAPTGAGFAYYQAKLYIDGNPTDAFLTVQEVGPPTGNPLSGLNNQFNISTVKQLSAGSHTFDIRMKRMVNQGTAAGANMPCQAISQSFNVSFLN